MARHPSFPAQYGFTLAELLVTLAVAMILAIGTAEFAPRIIQDSRMVSTVNAFVTILQRARSQAIKRGRQVVLCPSRDTATCGHSLDWQHGWLLFESDNREREPDEPLLRIGQPPGDGIRMYASNSRKRIVYQPTGTSGGSNSTFTFCGRNNHAKPRVICLSNTGRPRVTRTRCDGKPIICP
ncbi:MAG TPA: GspH/FimT family pseudopilin [Gammaproteobacteria bacterium]|jgi:type IV fimbrial biogenesis protein FimT|nr:GspH/FimT family pseudopilin [Gammaproteobacteria bacterium]